jgi:predicted glycosyltransferase
MKILFDLNHPAHFHLFKNSIFELKKKNYKIWITAREKDVLLDLLESSGFSYILLRKTNHKLWDHFSNIGFIRDLLKKEKIDIAVGVSALISQAAIFTKTKSVVFDDDDVSVTPVFALASHTFADHVIIPSVLKRNKKKYIYHHSLHELAYLHPEVFAPNNKILKRYNLNEKDFFSIIRLSALKAHHDIGEEGINYQQSIQILELLKAKGRVFVSSENSLPKNLEAYAIKSPNHFHHLLAFSKLLVCDSQTVASEAAVLGVPSVRINTFVGRISYLEELEHQYQLTYGFKPNQFDIAMQKIYDLSDGNRIEDFTKSRKRLLNEKIDLAAFLVWFLVNYSTSAKIMKENPEYQYNFK